MRARPPNSLKALLAQGVLALLLLFAQQQAAVHWLVHAADAKHAQSNGTLTADHCDECLALGALAAAAPASTLSLPASSAHHARAARPALRESPALLQLAFHSRAPPILS